MTLAEDLWLRGRAAQSSMMHLMAYNTAFAGTATLQAFALSMSAPVGFWAAVGRAGGAANDADDDNVVVLRADKSKRSTSAVKKAQKASGATPKAKAGAAAKPATAAKPVLAEVVSSAKPAKPAMPKKGRKVAQPKIELVEPPAPDPEPVDLGPSPHLLDAPRGGRADDLTSLKGVGAKLATALNEFGIYHFDQIATLDDEGIDWLDEQQKGFRMLCSRYDLVGQAKARGKVSA